MISLLSRTVRHYSKTRVAQCTHNKMCTAAGHSVTGCGIQAPFSCLILPSTSRHGFFLLFFLFLRQVTSLQVTCSSFETDGKYQTDSTNVNRRKCSIQKTLVANFGQKSNFNRFIFKKENKFRLCAEQLWSTWMRDMLIQTVCPIKRRKICGNTWAAMTSRRLLGVWWRYL